MGVRTATQKTVTAIDNAQIDTAQYKFGSASGLFDGNGDALSIPDSDDFYFGTGDFTIRFFARWSVLPTSGQQKYFYQQYQDANNQMYLRVEESGGNLYLQVYVKSGGSEILFTSCDLGTINTGTWYHLQFVRSGNDFKTYKDASQIGSTTTASITMPNYNATFYIGQFFGGGDNGFNGWIDEFEIAKGVARSASVPSGPIIPDEYTVLMLHFDGVDTSTTFTDDVTVYEGLTASISMESTVVGALQEIRCEVLAGAISMECTIVGALQENQITASLTPP
jgi:hypothetical protein